MVITKETIKELFEKLKSLNSEEFEFIYNAKTNTFGYADIEEIYFQGESIFIGTKKEILKFQEYRLNLEIDLTEKERKKSLNELIKKEDIEYINELKMRVKQIKSLPNNSLVGINDDGEILEGIELFKILTKIHTSIVDDRKKLLEEKEE